MQFKAVVGQQNIKQHLIDEVNHDKISHAQLFLGKQGYGGLNLALAFAQYIFCQNKTEKDSCGTCPSCLQAEKLQHPDLHFSFPTVLPISKTSDGLLNEWREINIEEEVFSLDDWTRKIDQKERKPIIGTDQSEEIIKKLSLKSFEGGYKIMIIWMAEEMNSTCSNKLLKIIEEPPEKTLFILISESSEKLLQTILSRTQIVLIPRINMEELRDHLVKNHSVNQSEAESISSRVDGDLLEAKEILKTSTEQDYNRELFIQLMRVCYKKSVLEMIGWAEETASLSKGRQLIFLKYALHMFRQSILKNYTQDILTRTSSDEDNFLDKFAKFITGNNIEDFMKTFNDAHYQIERNANSKILFTNLCFNVMRYIHIA
jgi:DNA polymerase-3 subunit delta'